MQDKCKLGLVHKWQTSPNGRTGNDTGSPFPSGMAVCACKSLAVQCPEAVTLWDFLLSERLTPDHVTWQSCQEVCWKSPDGRQWHQRVDQHVTVVRRHQANWMK